MFKVCRVQPSGRLIREREADVRIGVGIGGRGDSHGALTSNSIRRAVGLAEVPCVSLHGR
jgi:hypothetical protein